MDVNNSFATSVNVREVNSAVEISAANRQKIQTENAEQEVTTKMKKVSVVVATFRRENELKNALESLTKQTYPNMEIIVVDDNGDKTWNSRVVGVVEAFRSEHPEIPLKFIANIPNMGSAQTRNVGIDASEGEYITFLDDDDIYLPDKIRNQVEFMEDGGYDYSITDLTLYTEGEKEIDRRIRFYIKDTSVSALRMYNLKYHMTGTDTMMFRKEYLVRIQGFAPINVGDEFYLMQRAIEGGGKFGYLPRCDVKAYVHTGEGGLSSGDGKIEGENAIYEYKKEFFKHLKPKDVRYIKMRHYAVLAYAELRRKKLVQFVLYAIRAFFASPLDFFTLLK